MEMLFLGFLSEILIFPLVDVEKLELLFSLSDPDFVESVVAASLVHAE